MIAVTSLEDWRGVLEEWYADGRVEASASVNAARA
jgi:hypothetical protein